MDFHFKAIAVIEPVTSTVLLSMALLLAVSNSALLATIRPPAFALIVFPLNQHYHLAICVGHRHCCLKEPARCGGCAISGGVGITAETGRDVGTLHRLGVIDDEDGNGNENICGNLNGRVEYHELR